MKEKALPDLEDIYWICRSKLAFLQDVMASETGEILPLSADGRWGASFILGDILDDLDRLEKIALGDTPEKVVSLRRPRNRCKSPAPAGDSKT